MACDIVEDSRINPIWPAHNMGYDYDELTALISHIDSTRTWMKSLGVHQQYKASKYVSTDEGEGYWSDPVAASQDVIAVRLGVPYLGSDKTISAESLYTSAGSADRIIPTIGVDAIKMTASGVSYTYKSEFIHRIFSRYFIDGVDNRTGYTYLDGVDTSASKLHSIPVQYDGVAMVAPIIPEVITEADPLYKCIVYMSQNPKMMRNILSVTDLDAEENYIRKGDMLYMRTADFYDKLMSVKTNALEKRTRLADRVRRTDYTVDTFVGDELLVAGIFYPDRTPDYTSADWEEINAENTAWNLVNDAGKFLEIRELLETVGLDKAFEDMDYGGAIKDLRVVMKIPASREHQVTLQKLLQVKLDANGDQIIGADGELVKEVFSDVFVEKWESVKSPAGATTFTKHPEDTKNDQKRFSLEEPYSTDLNTLDLAWMDDESKLDDYDANDPKYVIDYEGLDTLDDVYNGNYGCYRFTPAVYGSDGDGGTEVVIDAKLEYRYWVVNDEWLQELSPADIAVVFWLGFDLESSMKNSCPYDQVIQIIVIVVLTYFGQVHLTGWAQAAMIASGVISIGLAQGAFGTGESARNAQIVAALLSLGSINWSTIGTATGRSILSVSIQIANITLDVYNTVTMYELQKKTEEVNKQIKELEDAEDFYNDLRVVYGRDSYETGVRNGPEANPYEYIDNIFGEFTTYKTSGFQ